MMSVQRKKKLLVEKLAGSEIKTYGWQSIAIRTSFNRSVPSAPPPPFGRLFVF